VGDHDADIQEIVAMIREMMRAPAATGRKIGFVLPAAKV
jgi:hypothetical protein